MTADAPGRPSPKQVVMFAFYSNRLGCVGSILVSVAGTLVLVGVIWLLSQ